MTEKQSAKEVNKFSVRILKSTKLLKSSSVISLSMYVWYRQKEIRVNQNRRKSYNV